jgi:hypothetical protein
MKQCGPHIHPRGSDIPPTLSIRPHLPTVSIRSAIPCIADPRIYPLPACAVDYGGQEGDLVDPGALFSNARLYRLILMNVIDMFYRSYYGT